MNVQYVNKLGLCSGCGACIAVCPNSALILERSQELNKPKVLKDSCSDCGRCLKTCPGFYNFDTITNKGIRIAARDKLKGPIGLICYSNDNSLRKMASSGGYITSLLLKLISQNKISGVITLKKDPESPIEYISVIITDEESLNQTLGSKYFPVSACVGLKELDKQDGCFAFVGKPCEITAARLLIHSHPEKYRGHLLLISLFCAHTPSRKSTKELLKKQGLNIEQIQEIRYRGNGWPGHFQVIGKNQTILLEKPYRDIWDNYLSRDPAPSCRLCMDPFGKLADISVGDAWGFEDPSGFGLSAILVRTELGLECHNYAKAAKGLSCERVRLKKIYTGQRSLFNKLKNKKIVKEILKIIGNGRIENVSVFILKESLSMEDKATILLLYLKIRHDIDIYRQLHYFISILKRSK